MVALRSQLTSPALSHSYIWQHIEIGYVQGMCDLLAPLLVILDDGEWVALLCFPCPCVWGSAGGIYWVGGDPLQWKCLEVWSLSLMLPGFQEPTLGPGWTFWKDVAAAGAAVPMQPCSAISPPCTEALAFSCFTELMKRMNQNFPHGGAMDTHFANMRSLIQVRVPGMGMVAPHTQEGKLVLEGLRRGFSAGKQEGQQGL